MHRSFACAWLVTALFCLGCIDPQAPAPQQPAPPTVSGPPSGQPVVKSMEKVKATVDTVGTKGKDYGGGIITEPIRQRFRLEDRLLLLTVDQAMNLYHAENGRYPASHDEFMKVIIQANQIKLPLLPEGQTYVYDPQTHTLMVERPQQ
jgi:hypothetical protein